MATLGGVHESQGEVEGQIAAVQNSADIEGLARFAVEEHNKKEVYFVLLFLFMELDFLGVLDFPPRF